MSKETWHYLKVTGVTTGLLVLALGLAVEIRGAPLEVTPFRLLATIILGGLMFLLIHWLFDMLRI